MLSLFIKYNLIKKAMAGLLMLSFIFSGSGLTYLTYASIDHYKEADKGVMPASYQGLVWQTPEAQIGSRGVESMQSPVKLPTEEPIEPPPPTGKTPKQRIADINALGAAAEAGSGYAVKGLEYVINNPFPQEEKIAAYYMLGRAVSAGNETAINVIMDYIKNAPSEGEKFDVLFYLNLPDSGNSQKLVKLFVEIAKDAGMPQALRQQAIKNMAYKISPEGFEAISYVVADKSAPEALRGEAIYSLRTAVENDNAEAIKISVDFAADKGASEGLRGMAMDSLIPAVSKGNAAVINKLLDIYLSDDNDYIKTIIEYDLAQNVSEKNKGLFIDIIKWNKEAKFDSVKSNILYSLVIGKVINKEETKELFPVIKKMNQEHRNIYDERDIFIQKSIANILVTIAVVNSTNPAAGYLFNPLSWVWGNSNEIKQRDGIFIQHNTDALVNKTGRYDRQTIEAIIGRAIFLDVDPYLALGAMMAEFPIIIDGRDLQAPLWVGEIQINPNAIEELATKNRQLSRKALSGSVPGEDAVISLNDYGTLDTRNALSFKVFEEAGIADMVEENLFLVHASNLDTSLSRRGNLGLLYLRTTVQDKRLEDIRAGRSLAYTIQRYNGLGISIANGVDTTIDPFYGKRVLDYINNALIENVEIKEIIDKYSRLYDKPVVNMRR